MVTTQGNINLKVAKNIHLDATQGIYMKASEFNAEIDGNWTEKVTGTNTKTGKTINLN